jgi:hypothetical protein
MFSKTKEGLNLLKRFKRVIKPKQYSTKPYSHGPTQESLEDGRTSDQEIQRWHDFHDLNPNHTHNRVKNFSVVPSFNQHLENFENLDDVATDPPAMNTSRHQAKQLMPDLEEAIQNVTYGKFDEDVTTTQTLESGRSMGIPDIDTKLITMLPGTPWAPTPQRLIQITKFLQENGTKGMKFDEIRKVVVDGEKAKQKQKFDLDVRGFIAPKKDDELEGPPDDVVERLRLDYPGGKPRMGNKFIHYFDSLIDPNSVSVPLRKDLGGDMDPLDNPYPFTGTGFTSSRLPRIIPEFFIPSNKANKILPGTPLEKLDDMGLTNEDGIFNGSYFAKKENEKVPTKTE